MKTIKELLDEQKLIRENASKPKRKPGPKPKVTKDADEAEEKEG